MEEVASCVCQPQFTCWIAVGQGAGVDQKGDVLPVFGDQQIHDLAADYGCAFYLADAVAAEVLVKSVSQLFAERGRTAGRRFPCAVDPAGAHATPWFTASARTSTEQGRTF
ncbi:hypothetical protein [Streptomyces sp. Ag109_O5-1]|uniref:hypothetical protein n=1 Tax=Streptomyces sp. Ag109_O5-1 TaxID=1938851 RepID=UPI000F4D6301|nr:hypothetical protein [Streptomyces sp. Ag109_O5-1]